MRGNAADTPLGRTITVVATGTAMDVPDRASFQFSVDSRAKTAKEALAKNAAATTALINGLTTAGVTASDLQTNGVWLSPQFVPGGALTGYVASNGVTAKTLVAHAGALVDAAVAAGATYVYGPNLLISDATALANEALKNAASNAAGRAAALAAGAGLTLGRVRTIAEGTQQYPAYPTAAPSLAPSPSGAVSTPILPGTQTMSATVTVVYDAN